jgi:hypothetical protein
MRIRQRLVAGVFTAAACVSTLTLGSAVGTDTRNW